MLLGARPPLLAVSGAGGLGHADRLHAVGVGVVRDVVVQLVGRDHPRGDREAPWSCPGKHSKRDS